MFSTRFARTALAGLALVSAGVAVAQPQPAAPAPAPIESVRPAGISSTQMEVFVRSALSRLAEQVAGASRLTVAEKAELAADINHDVSRVSELADTLAFEAAKLGDIYVPVGIAVTFQFEQNFPLGFRGHATGALGVEPGIFFTLPLSVQNNVPMPGVPRWSAMTILAGEFAYLPERANATQNMVRNERGIRYKLFIGARDPHTGLPNVHLSQYRGFYAGGGIETTQRVEDAQSGRTRHPGLSIRGYYKPDLGYNGVISISFGSRPDSPPLAVTQKNLWVSFVGDNHGRGNSLLDLLY